ncbi:flagellar hook-length control protein FliK [Treponema sp. TIM-1]|uniref:flagellar hook-length control protein FliK n=1 Tax=Treponema sp. TIM-1 TaxID=2898417 RepID=UPI0039816A73
MQISPQINLESPQEVRDQGSLAISKDKLGVFSKLLEGLLRNSNHPPGAEQIADPEGHSQIPDEFPRTAGESGSLKKTDPRGIKGSLLSRGDKKIRGKETPDLFAQEALPGKKARGTSPDQTEEGRELTAEEAVFSQFPETAPEKFSAEKTSLDHSPEPVPEESLAENPVLSGEITPPVPQNTVNHAGLQEEDLPRVRKTGEGRTLRDPADASRQLTRETESAGVRLAQVSGKTPGDPEKTGPASSRRNDSGSRDKRRERLEMEVRDLRTGQVPEVSINRGPAFIPEAAGGIREVELRLELPGGSRSSGEALSTGTGTPARAFEEILAGELRGGLGDDIVRQASIILKDGGAGLIRLTLKPESLGNVKIRLEMAENKIAGRIIVESNEALRAFEREMQSLEQAFKDSGFNGASIEMSVSSDNRGNQGNRQGKGEDTSPFFSERLHLAASGYESIGDLLVLSGNPGDPAALRPVNMLV